MKNFTFFQTIFSVALIAGLSQFGWSAAHSPAQAQANASSAARAASSTAAMASAKGQSAEIKNGTKISTELMSNIDARTARPGDKVVARVTKNVKQHGKVVIRKGDTLVGHITSVQDSLKGKGGSRLGVRFDQLVQGSTTTQLNAVLTSVLSAHSSGQAEGSESMGMPPMPAPVAVPAGGGGLLGGVGSAVGSTVNAAGSAVGGLGGAVGSTVDGTVGAAGNGPGNLLATPSRAIHLQNEAHTQGSGNAQAHSLLSTKHGDLRLAPGTGMRFRVVGEGSSNANTNAGVSKGNVHARAGAHAHAGAAAQANNDEAHRP